LQRLWWIFTPSQITGGIIYYPGAAVDGRAYFPLAFEIAARGHLVVVVQQPLRNAVFTFQDANVVLNSNLSVFSGNVKSSLTTFNNFCLEPIKLLSIHIISEHKKSALSLTVTN
jgi:hypothetical protein